MEIDGKKREFYAKIFPYWELKDVSVDEKYLQELHKVTGQDQPIFILLNLMDRELFNGQKL